MCCDMSRDMASSDYEERMLCAHLRNAPKEQVPHARHVVGEVPAQEVILPLDARRSNERHVDDLHRSVASHCILPIAVVWLWLVCIHIHSCSTVSQAHTQLKERLHTGMSVPCASTPAVYQPSAGARAPFASRQDVR